MPLTRRRILSLGCGLGASAWLAGIGFEQVPANAPSSHRSIDDPLYYVNPEFRPTLEQLVKTNSAQLEELNTSTLPQLRANLSHARPVLPYPPVEEKMIPGLAGAPQVRVFIVGAKQGGSKPAVLHIHGGGYVAGSARTAKRDLQEIATAHECVAVSADYSLAPETPFPGSLEDNYAVLRWLYTNARELGVDTKRIAIKGESAGGGHAAALAIAALKRAFTDG